MADLYVDGAVGNDSNAGTSPGAGNAWATIAKLLATMAGGDTGYVKASANYDIGTGLSTTVDDFNKIARVVGYTSSITDRGKATIRATSNMTGLTVGTSGNVFENFTIDANGHTGLGVSLGAGG